MNINRIPKWTTKYVTVAQFIWGAFILFTVVIVFLIWCTVPIHRVTILLLVTLWALWHSLFSSFDFEHRWKISAASACLTFRRKLRMRRLWRWFGRWWCIFWWRFFYIFNPWGIVSIIENQKLDVQNISCILSSLQTYKLAFTTAEANARAFNVLFTNQTVANCSI